MASRKIEEHLNVGRHWIKADLPAKWRNKTAQINELIDQSVGKTAGRSDGRNSACKRRVWVSCFNVFSSPRRGADFGSFQEETSEKTWYIGTEHRICNQICATSWCQWFQASQLNISSPDVFWLWNLNNHCLWMQLQATSYANIGNVPASLKNHVLLNRTMSTGRPVNIPENTWQYKCSTNSAVSCTLVHADGYTPTQLRRSLYLHVKLLHGCRPSRSLPPLETLVQFLQLLLLLPQKLCP